MIFANIQYYLPVSYRTNAYIIVINVTANVGNPAITSHGVLVGYGSQQKYYKRTRTEPSTGVVMAGLRQPSSHTVILYQIRRHW